MTLGENGSFPSKLNAMKKYLLAVALFYSVSEALFAQLTAVSEGFATASITDVIESSSGAVSARIVGMEVYWNEEHTLCYNHYTLEVLGSSNEDLPKKIVLVAEVSNPSGHQVSADNSSFEVGSEVFAYLSKIPRNWECGYTPKHAYSALFTAR